MSFRQIFLMTALKILAIPQYDCKFLLYHQKNFVRKSAHNSYVDRFLSETGDFYEQQP